MTGNDSGNAMTEIALALAMAFFAIMILTMVSMGGGGRAGPAGVVTPATATVGAKSSIKAPPDGLRLLPPASQATTRANAGSSPMLQPRQLIIFSGGRFLNEKLQPLTPAAMQSMAQPVLAVSPELSLAQVMAAKDRLSLPGLTVTTLNRQWLDALKEHHK